MLPYESVFEADATIFYNELHKRAEASGEEKETSAFIRMTLEQAGFNVQTFKRHYGLIAELKGKSDEVIALRADMDAVVQEVDGVMQANHSCGHDAHSAMMLAAALLLKERGKRPEKTIRFLFQPAEETGEGAIQMIGSGAMNNVTSLIGIHLRPEREVPFGQAAPVILHGSSATLNGTIRGRPAHAARPELGRNVIESAAQIVQAIYAMTLNESCSFSVKMTQLYAGAKSANIIPDNARFSLDLRAETNQGMAELIERTEHAVRTVGRLSETEIKWTIDGWTPAAEPNKKMIQSAEYAITQVMGQHGLASPCRTNGAEDFHFYTANCPNVYATMIGLGCNMQEGLHHPHMSFELDALKQGVRILLAILAELAS